MSTPPFDHRKTEELALAIMAALGITRPVCALTLHWRAGELATVTVEEPMCAPLDGAANAVAQLSKFVLTPAATSQEASHAG